MERNKKRRSRRLAAGILLSTVGIGLAAIFLLYTHPSYIYIPDREHVLNPRRPAATVRTAQTPENPEPTDEETLDLGRRAFYGETFGN